jgi:hypothetical protein
MRVGRRRDNLWAAIFPTRPAYQCGAVRVRGSGKGEEGEIRVRNLELSSIKKSIQQLDNRLPNRKTWKHHNTSRNGLLDQLSRSEINFTWQLFRKK